MGGFKIPRLESIAARIVGRTKGKQSKRSMLDSRAAATVAQCQHCRYVHNLNSYCSRKPRATKMVKRRDRRIRISTSSSSSSSSSSEDGELSDASGSALRRSYSRSPSDSEGDGDEVKRDTSKEGKTADPLEGFFSAQKRVDAKEPNLTLLPSSIKYYFSTVLKNGELTKEGREEMQDKYFLDPTQYETFRPPRLDDTKLFKLGDKEFLASRAGRLISLHTKTRDVAKLSLATLEEVGLAATESEAYKPALIYDEDGEKLDRYKVDPVDLILNQPERDSKAEETLATLKKQYSDKLTDLDLAAELWAERRRARELEEVMHDLAEAKEQDRSHIGQLRNRIDKIKSLALDQTTLLGQVDIGIWGAREVTLERFLNPEFKRALHIQNRARGGDKETRHESNSLLHRDLDSMVTRRSKESKVDHYRRRMSL